MVYIRKAMEMIKEKTIVIIPSYNEGRTIGAIVKEIIAMGLQVLIVDDGSKDNTRKEALEHGGMVIKNKVNSGKGKSIRVGLDYVTSKTKYNWAVLMDGDGQHHPEDIPIMMESAVKEDADMVLGDRMAYTKNMPLIRLLTNMFTSFIISCLCRVKVKDSQCGFRMIRVHAFRKITLISDRYDIESEMIIEAAKKGLKIISSPVRTIYGDESSQINPAKDSVRFIKLIMSYLFGKNRE